MKNLKIENFEFRQMFLCKVTPTFVASAAVGACIGAFISWIVNCTLVEVHIYLSFEE